MSVRGFAAQLKTEISAAKAQGSGSIDADALIAYLTSVENSPEAEPSPAELERYKAELAQNIEAMKLDNASDLEMFRSVIVAGQNATRAIILINGGASVAILAFLGHLARIGAENVSGFAGALLPFAAGTLLGGLISGTTYLSQWLYASEKKWAQKVGFGFNILAILFGLSAFIAFGYGVYEAYHMFVTNPPIANPNFVQLI